MAYRNLFPQLIGLLLLGICYLTPTGAEGQPLHPSGRSCHLHGDITTGSGDIYRMVILGDSVMWGQGHREEAKFPRLIQDWISERNRRVQKLIYAHSGATIDDRGGPYKVMTHGEVPSSTPTIKDQVDCVPESFATETELVLVDGCINDFNASSILDPTVDNQWIRNHAHARCGDPMRTLLRRILVKFPRALVIVTGYFPLVSGQSDPTEVAKLVEIFGPGPVIVGALTGLALRNKLTAQSNQWYDISNEILQHVVNEINPDRIAFAHIPFGPENAFGASRPFLFPIPDMGSKEDPVFGGRRAACNVNNFGDLKCWYASGYHPNAEGQTAYRHAVLHALKGLWMKTKSPCPFGGQYDGANCFVMADPFDADFFKYEGKYYYTAVHTNPCPYQPAPFNAGFDGANCLINLPSGSQPFIYDGNLYLEPACRDCDNPCPQGGSYDGANCFIMGDPPDANFFLHQEKYYYTAVRKNPTCPYKPGSLVAEYDGANCYIKVPAGAKPFIHNGGFYLEYTPPWSVPASIPTWMPKPAVQAASPEKIHSLQSVNFPNHFIRHRNSLAGLTEIHSELDKYDASFAIVPGLADSNGVSFESVNYPRHYLRHRDFRVRIDNYSDDPLFKADATFHALPGLADQSKSSFRSHNFPDRYIRHRNFELVLDSDTGGPYRQDATFAIVGPFKLGVRSLQAMNFPEHFLRHRNFLVDLTKVQNELDAYDASFVIVTGLADSKGISFESVNYPGHYLRHQDFRLKLAPRTDDDLFKADATFYVMPGLGGPSKSSFRSFNFPDRYIRHRNFELVLEPDTGGPFREDATFTIVGSFKE